MEFELAPATEKGQRQRGGRCKRGEQSTKGPCSLTKLGQGESKYPYALARFLVLEGRNNETGKKGKNPRGGQKEEGGESILVG